MLRLDGYKYTHRISSQKFAGFFVSVADYIFSFARIQGGQSRFDVNLKIEFLVNASFSSIYIVHVNFIRNRKSSVVQLQVVVRSFW